MTGTDKGTKKSARRNFFDSYSEKDEVTIVKSKSSADKVQLLKYIREVKCNTNRSAQMYARMMAGYWHMCGLMCGLPHRDPLPIHLTKDITRESHVSYHRLSVLLVVDRHH